MNTYRLLNPPKGVRRLSLLAGFVAGETCSAYAIFVAHTMNPIGYLFVQDNPTLRTLYGRYQEVYSLHGLVFTVAASLAVSAIAWCSVRGVAWAIVEFRDWHSIHHTLPQLPA